MADRRDSTHPAFGYLKVAGEGGYSAHDLQRLLAAMDASYQACARVELAARQLVATVEWLERHGPPPRYWLPPAVFLPTPFGAELEPADPLVVSRVVLESPGFWEFLGHLNPLEVLRKYLTDRHERKKDHLYRSAAERERLAIENAMRRLDVVERIARLEREFGRDLYMSGAWRQGWAAELRPAFKELGELDDRQLISGESATIRPDDSDQHDPLPDEAD